MLREALALWRGRPLAEFDEPFARIEGGRLEDIRLAAIEQRIEADLALGGEADLIGELEALIVENPTRERLRAQLMLALYRFDPRQRSFCETHSLKGGPDVPLSRSQRRWGPHLSATP